MIETLNRPGNDRPYLPDDVLRQIVVITIALYPYTRYTLQLVCTLLEETVVRSVGYERTNINPSQTAAVPRHVIVARLSRTFGRYSGVMLAVR
jgi:hypothetical protein